MKIYKITTSDKLSEYELERFKEKTKAEWAVYDYEIGHYDGSGFMIWRKNKKYYYHDMGHCSCYGPTEEVAGISYNSFKEIEKIGRNYTKAKGVIELIKMKKLISRKCVKKLNKNNTLP